MLGDEKGARPLEDLARGSHLHEPARSHHPDAITERQRFGIVVGDVEGSHPAELLQVVELLPELVADARVEVADRFVQQIDLRLRDQGAGEGGALLLTAGDLPRPALEQLVDPQHRGHLPDGALDLGSRELARPERARDVLEDGQVRIEGIAFEGHRDVAPVGR